MRVALFFDGKNFYRALSETQPGLEVDYDRLASWVVGRVGGAAAEFHGAYYYTGHTDGFGGTTHPFTAFLNSLNLRTGFFVRREPRVRRVARCRHCGRARSYMTEKRVDTRLVADMIHYAAVAAYDVAVLFSGDQDLVPAVEAAERLGRRVYVATWAGRGLSSELRHRCFGEINLVDGIAAFATGRVRATPGPAGTPAVAHAPAAAGHQPMTSASVAAEVAVAQGKLTSYVSRWYFENKWIGAGLPAMATPERTASVQMAIHDGAIEEYDYTDPRGKVIRAIRVRQP